MLTGGLILFSVLTQPIYLGFLVLSFGNYLLWAGIPAMRGHAKTASSAKRRKKFNSEKIGSDAAFHCCNTCKKTEITDPALEFRMSEDGNEYCLDHLPD